MKYIMLALAVTGVLSTLLLVCPMARGIEPEDIGLPPRLQSLLDLGPVLRRTDLTSVQKTEVLILWLREERAHPSPTTKGRGGGDISSSHTQAQIVKSLREVGDPVLLRNIVSDKKSDTNIRDAACLALGLIGDSTQLGRLVAILRSSREPHFRALAAEAIGILGGIQAVPVLKNALSDKFEEMSSRGKLFPVREAAENTLRIFGQPEAELKSYVEEYAKRFAERLDKAEKEKAKSP